MPGPAVEIHATSEEGRACREGNMPGRSRSPAASRAPQPQTRRGGLLACVYTALFVIVPTLSLWYKHHELHKAVMFNWTYMFLSLFVVINTMISVWEISLHIYSKWITDSFQELKKLHKKDSFPPVFMFQPVAVTAAAVILEGVLPLQLLHILLLYLSPAVKIRC